MKLFKKLWFTIPLVILVVVLIGFIIFWMGLGSGMTKLKFEYAENFVCDNCNFVYEDYWATAPKTCPICKNSLVKAENTDNYVCQTAGCGFAYEDYHTTVIPDGCPDCGTIGKMKLQQYYAVTDLLFQGSSKVEIPETYKGFPVLAISKQAFQSCSGLKTLVVPASVISFGKDVFQYSGLSRIVYKGDVKGWVAVNQMSLDKDSNVVFELYFNETEAENIDLTGVTRVNKYAFANCSSVKTVKIPEEMQILADQCFYKCTSLSNIEYNAVNCANSETPIFRGDVNKADLKVQIGAYVKKIPTGIFSSSAVTEITFLDGSTCTEICGGAFEKCSFLKKINNLSKELQTIGLGAFDGCTSLEELNLTETRISTLESYAFRGCMAIKTFTVPAGIKKIEDNLFDTCTALELVMIPDSVTEIGPSAFSGCESLTAAVLPASVRIIGKQAFQGCAALTSIVVPEAVTDIGLNAFADCSSLVEFRFNAINCKDVSSNPSDLTAFLNRTISGDPFTVVIGEGVTKIPAAFFNKAEVNAVLFAGNSNCTSIGNKAFANTTVLTGFNIPARVSTIGNEAFKKSVSLGSISIGASVNSIGSSAFSGCVKLASINVDAANAKYQSIDGNLYDKAGTKLMQYACGKESDAFSVPATVTEIDKNAFMSAINLKTISIPASVKKIGSSAFSGTRLSEISYTGTIGEWCGISFADESANPITSAEKCRVGGQELTNVVVSDVETIKDFAFCGCVGLTDLQIRNVATIGKKAFAGCTGLATLTMEGVNVIDTNAFSGCTALQQLAVPAGLRQIKANAFENCTALQTVTFADNAELTTIGASAFTGCTALTSFRIPNSVNSLGMAAFNGCSALAEVTLPSGLTDIPPQIFMDCAALTGIVLPESVQSIGDSAFEGCVKLATVDATKATALTMIGGAAFKGCAELTELPTKTAREIGEEAFFGCAKAQALVLSEELTTVENSAFATCSGILTIMFDGNAAFKFEKGGLYRVTGENTYVLIQALLGSEGTFAVLDGTTEIAPNALNGARYDRVEFPESLTTIGKNAFYNTRLSGATYAGSKEDWAKVSIDTSNAMFTSDKDMIPMTYLK